MHLLPCIIIIYEQLIIKFFDQALKVLILIQVQYIIFKMGCLQSDPASKQLSNRPIIQEVTKRSEFKNRKSYISGASNSFISHGSKIGLQSKILGSSLNDQKCDLADQGLTIVDLGLYTNYKIIIIDNNQISTVNPEHCSQLLHLSVKNNQLNTINLRNNTNLMELYLSGNSLTSIDLSSLAKLSILALQSNQLTSINLQANYELANLDLSQNNLQQINLAKNIKIDTLFLSSNKLETIDISKNILLKQLWLCKNNLAQINLIENVGLTDLSLSQNKLTNVDLSHNNFITHLQIQKNQLQNILLANLTELKQLKIAYNQLTNINLQNNTELLYFDLKGNMLQRLFFFYTGNLSLEQISVGDQKSNKCQIQILYKADSSNKCNSLKDALTNKYSVKLGKRASINANTSQPFHRQNDPRLSISQQIIYDQISIILFSQF